MFDEHAPDTGGKCTVAEWMTKRIQKHRKQWGRIKGRIDAYKPEIL